MDSEEASRKEMEACFDHREDETAITIRDSATSDSPKIIANNDTASGNVDENSLSQNEPSVCESQSQTQEQSQDSQAASKRPPLPPGMSRNQYRKQLKWEKMLAEKAERRRQERQRRRENRAARRQQAQSQATSEDGAKVSEARVEPEKRNFGRFGKKYYQSQMDLMEREGSLTVVFDCSFDEYMNHREKASLVKQLTYAYGHNIRVDKPVKFVMTGLKPDTETSKILARVSGSDAWAWYRDERGFEERYADRLHDVVYLTADSPNVLTELVPNEVYIVGGIVDHNRLKGLTYRIAKEKGVRTARLPLPEALSGGTRNVLTIVNMLELLVAKQDTPDWGAALLKSLPERWRWEEKREDTTSCGQESKSQDHSEDDGYSDDQNHEADYEDEDNRAASAHDNDEGLADPGESSVKDTSERTDSAVDIGDKRSLDSNQGPANKKVQIEEDTVNATKFSPNASEPRPFTTETSVPFSIRAEDEELDQILTPANLQRSATFL